MKILIGLVIVTHIYWALILIFGFTYACDLIGCADAVAVMRQWPIVGPLIPFIGLLGFYVAFIYTFLGLLGRIAKILDGVK